MDADDWFEVALIACLAVLTGYILGTAIGIL